MRTLGLISLALICVNAMAAEVELIDSGGFEKADAVRRWRATTWRGEGANQLDADVKHAGEKFGLIGNDAHAPAGEPGETDDDICRV